MDSISTEKITIKEYDQFALPYMKNVKKDKFIEFKEKYSLYKIDNEILRGVVNDKNEWKNFTRMVDTTYNSELDFSKSI